MNDDHGVFPSVYEVFPSVQWTAVQEPTLFKSVEHFFALKESNPKLWKKILKAAGPPAELGKKSDWLTKTGKLKKGMAAMTHSSLIPCPYGGGDQCLKHGGDGAAAHKMGYAHKFPHVAELGGRPAGVPKGNFVSKKQKYQAGVLDSSASLMLQKPKAQPAGKPAESAQEAQEAAEQAPSWSAAPESDLGTPFIKASDVKFPKPGNTLLHGQTGLHAGVEYKYIGTSIGGHPVFQHPSGSYHMLGLHAVEKGEVTDDHAPWAGLGEKALVKAPSAMIDQMNSALAGSPHYGASYKTYIDDFTHSGYATFVVGGAVREMVAGNTSKIKDIDIVTNAPWNTVQKIASKHGHVINDAPFVALCQVGTGDNKADALDITCLRAADQWGDNGPLSTGLGGGQKVCGNIASDVNSRDFACNALFYDTQNQMIIDPTGRGISDAQNKILSPSYVDGGKQVWLGNNRLGIRIVKMLMRGYKMSKELKEVYTPAQFEKHMKDLVKTKGLSKIAAWTVRQVAADITKENGWSSINNVTKEKAIERLMDFRKAMIENGFEDVYKKYLGPALMDYTGSVKLTG